MRFSHQSTGRAGAAHKIGNKDVIDLLQFPCQQAVKSVFQMKLMASPTAISHAGAP
jgi:hypothetical protein